MTAKMRSPSHLTVPLYQAVSAPLVIQLLLRIAPSSIAQQNAGGLMPLHCAIEHYETPVYSIHWVVILLVLLGAMS